MGTSITAAACAGTGVAATTHASAMLGGEGMRR